MPPAGLCNGIEIRRLTLQMREAVAAPIFAGSRLRVPGLGSTRTEVPRAIVIASWFAIYSLLATITSSPAPTRNAFRAECGASSQVRDVAEFWGHRRSGGFRNQHEDFCLVYLGVQFRPMRRASCEFDRKRKQINLIFFFKLLLSERVLLSMMARAKAYDPAI